MGEATQDEAAMLLANVESSFTDGDLKKIKSILDQVKESDGTVQTKLAGRLQSCEPVIAYVEAMLQEGPARRDPVVYAWLYEWYQTGNVVLQRFVTRFIPSMVVAYLRHHSSTYEDPNLAVCLVGLYNMSGGNVGQQTVPDVKANSIYHAVRRAPDAGFVPSPPSLSKDLRRHASFEALSIEPMDDAEEMFARGDLERRRSPFITQVNDQNSAIVLTNVLNIFVRDICFMPVDALATFCNVCERITSQGYDIQLDMQEAQKQTTKKKKRLMKLPNAKSISNMKEKTKAAMIERVEGALEKGSQVKSKMVNKLKTSGKDADSISQQPPGDLSAGQLGQGSNDEFDDSDAEGDAIMVPTTSLPPRLGTPRVNSLGQSRIKTVSMQLRSMVDSVLAHTQTYRSYDSDVSAAGDESAIDVTFSEGADELPTAQILQFPVVPPTQYQKRIHLPDSVMLSFVRGLFACTHMAELYSEAFTALRIIHARALIELRECVLLCTSSSLELIRDADRYVYEKEPNLETARAETSSSNQLQLSDSEEQL